MVNTNGWKSSGQTRQTPSTTQSFPGSSSSSCHSDLEEPNTQRRFLFGFPNFPFPSRVAAAAPDAPSRRPLRNVLFRPQSITRDSDPSLVALRINTWEHISPLRRLQTAPNLALSPICDAVDCWPSSIFHFTSDRA